MDFEAWWKNWADKIKETGGFAGDYEEQFAYEAWDYQQQRITALENALRVITATVEGANLALLEGE